MDNIRIILFAALAFILLLLWQAWQRDYGQPPPMAAQPATTSGTATQAPSAEIPHAPADTAAVSTAVPLPAGQASGTLFQTGTRITVLTDVLRVVIDTVGGDVRRLDLVDYPEEPQTPDRPFRLLNDSLPDVFVAQSGLYSAEQQAPSHLAVFASDTSEYRLADDASELSVPLTWADPSGVTVVKTYTFHRGAYVIDLTQTVENKTGAVWIGREYRQLQRTEPPKDDKQRFIHTYLGGAIYSEQDKYQKISFKDMESSNLDRDVKGGWVAMIQHYFLGAWVPPADQLNNFFTRTLSQGRHVIGMYSPAETIPDGASYQFHTRLVAGPKLQKHLADVAPGLELTVDYGLLTVLAQPVFWLLDKIHSLIGNWGWSIIFVTVIIKLLFFKLSETSYRSMANMRRLSPRLQALKERYGDDRQRLNQAMMEIYKKEKINPLGGCLPIVVQIPVFISLYWVLLETVELRQAPFMLWITDLSGKDPYYVLPVVMGITMFVQQKLNPAPMDPIQAKVMMALPLIFTVFFAFFPSGLVLYWVVNNILSVAQQWVITRRIERGATK